jgi:hypothetical protein
LTATDIARIGLPFPFPFEELEVATAYLAVMANTYVGIYSGVSRTDPTQGVIVVASEAADAFKSPFASPALFTEPNTGTLSISRVVGAVVTLKDAHGRLHTLNIQTQMFS